MGLFNREPKEQHRQWPVTLDQLFEDPVAYHDKRILLEKVTVEQIVPGYDDGETALMVSSEGSKHKALVYAYRSANVIARFTKPQDTVTIITGRFYDEKLMGGIEPSHIEAYRIKNHNLEAGGLQH